jgi:uncharacterized YigZ family protein
VAVERYPIPAATARVEEEIKRSRFIATLAYAPSPERAREFIDSVRSEFPDATHNCWAYAAGPPGSTSACASSDDGEPGGSAGRPMLGALLSSGVGDVAVVVTRYFGGVKLGRGGLARAYGGAVLRALAETKRGEHVTRVAVEAIVPYAAVSLARRLFEAHEARVEGETFSQDATFALTVPAHRLAELEAALRDATAGAAVVARRNGRD